MVNMKPGCEWSYAKFAVLVALRYVYALTQTAGKLVILTTVDQGKTCIGVAIQLSMFSGESKHFCDSTLGYYCFLNNFSRVRTTSILLYMNVLTLPIFAQDYSA